MCLRNLTSLRTFVGYYETAETDSATLLKAICDVLLRLCLSLNDCRGQCYDGTSNMAGRLTGVQAMILDRCSKALYEHCSAHSLNLAVQDATRCVSLIHHTLDLVKDLTTRCKNLARSSCAEDTEWTLDI